MLSYLDMIKKHVKKVNLFDINLTFESEKDYSILEEFKDFQTTCEETDYIYEIEECEEIPKDGKLLYSVEDFSIYTEGETEIRRFVRYELAKEENGFGVETRFPKDDSISLTFSKGILEAYKGKLLVIQYLGLEKLLLQKDGFLLHASLIEHQNMGIAFSAPSGTGKSTQAELWKKYRNAEIINGDRAGIRKMENGEFMAYGSPMAGSSGIVKNKKVSLQAIVILRQDKQNTIERMKPRDSFLALYSEALFNKWDEKYMQKLTELLIDVSVSVPVYLLKCRPDEEAVEILEKELKM